jgi:hypothetical protein
MNLTTVALRQLIEEELSFLLEADSIPQDVSLALQNLGFTNIKYIASGQYGDVFSGTWQSQGGVPRAIKVMNYDASGKREAALYRRVSDARSKSEAIAKHFPKVDLVRVSENKKLIMIVMELLESDPNTKGVIEDIFGYREVGSFRPDMSLQDLDIFKDIGYRANMMVVDDKSRAKLIKDMGFSFPQEVKSKIEKTILSMNFDSIIFPQDKFNRLKMKMAFKKHPAWEVTDVAEEDLQETGKTALSFLFYFLTYSMRFIKQYDNTITDNDILDELRYSVEHFIESYRNYTPVGIGGINYPGAPQETGGLGYPGAASLLKAIEDLKNIAGLEARDMHDRNVLARSRTKDIVIVDVGLFSDVSTSTPSYEDALTVIEGKMSKSYCMKTPCKDMGFSQRASCAKYKKCPSPKKKNERKLTKPEYKKKKQIAKALEKDSPNMPDDKKYAIATATAKRVAEEQCLEERCQKSYKTHPTRKTKKMFGKSYRNCVKAEEGKDPKKGTGKKPKGSGRRLYTDEDPSDTVSVSFKSVSAIQKTLAKKSFKSKSHKRQSQIINLIHQRARAAYQNAKDPEVKARLKKAYEYAKKRKEASKRKTIRLRKQKKKK